jgi:thioredoxin 1
MAKIIEAGESDFGAEVLHSPLPVLAVFWSPWSRPCKVLEPALEEIAAANEQLKLVKVNADDNPVLSLTFQVQYIPSLLYFIRGKLRATTVGTVSKEAILSKLQAILKEDSAAESASSPPK